ncbi:LCP family protein [Thermolongibacillus altinsuensis]|uniref:LCP family protein n=1 Tax=Thermolongibacillus altinsuensis TaxID=575256 RepID=UPI00242A2C06|nr:LCP family protein [Thermolongibacillus altinsuensis]GMB09148.1 LytR family transcriptional regulator [Thermolongibacillus altinsuensis]
MQNRRMHKIIRKKRKRRRALFFILLPLLAIIIGGATYASFLLNKAQSVIQNSFEEIEGREKPRIKEVDPNSDNISVLFIGVDDSDVRQKRSMGAVRSDALVLATFNAKEKSVKLLSIPRDSYVYIPVEKKYDKITHAHAYGGVKATVETVEELLDIPVDYYVKMNFEAFVDVVDELGGIEYDVPYELYEMDSKDRRDAIHLKPGLQTLNGEEALALARTRKYDSDIERGKRQQELIKAIFKKATTIHSLTKYDDILEAVGKNMTTNLTFDEIMGFLAYVTKGKTNIETLHLEGQDTTISGVYYYQLDEANVDEIKQTLKDHLDVSSYHAKTEQLAQEQ